MNSIFAITLHIFTFLLLYADRACEGTLSTAIFRDDRVSAKPTALYRRIAVDRNVEDQAVTSPDLFPKTDLRRNRDNIWNWDYLCQLQPQTGNCTIKRQKYFYNSMLDQCLPFTYTGCRGNKNNFNNVLECERHCKGAAFMSLRSIDRSTACALQPNVGLCVALFDNYYYDVNKRSCNKFVYSGCGGNQNRFSTKHKCLKKCGKKDHFDE